MAIHSYFLPVHHNAQDRAEQRSTCFKQKLYAIRHDKGKLKM